MNDNILHVVGVATSDAPKVAPLIWLTILIGASIGIFIFVIIRDWFFQRTNVTKFSAHRLLFKSCVDEWNEFRDLVPSWKPQIKSLDIKNVDLDSANFHHATIVACRFESVSLTDAIFDEATISNTLFKDVAFTGSTFLNCRIESISLVSVVIDEVSRAQLEFALNRKLSTAEVRDVAKTLDEIDFRGILEHLQKNPELVDQLTRTQFETVLEGLVADSGHETLRASEGFNAWFLSVRKSRESDQRKACVIDYLSVPRDRAVGAAPIRKIARRIARCAYGNGLFITNGSLTYDAKRAAEAYGVSIVDRQMLLKVFADPKSLVDAISFEP